MGGWEHGTRDHMVHMFPLVSKTKQIYIETSQFYPLDMNEILDLIFFWISNCIGFMNGILDMIYIYMYMYIYTGVGSMVI